MVVPALYRLVPLDLPTGAQVDIKWDGHELTLRLPGSPILLLSDQQVAWLVNQSQSLGEGVCLLDHHGRYRIAGQLLPVQRTALRIPKLL